jgi:hypothetical protein
MTSDEWKAFLATWTHEIGEQDAKNPNTKRTIDPTYGLGFPGATDSDIAAAEARLGTNAAAIVRGVSRGDEWIAPTIQLRRVVWWRFLARG